MGSTDDFVLAGISWFGAAMSGIAKVWVKLAVSTLLMSKKEVAMSLLLLER
ncbi:hypothetical protein C900_02033 [Fulvivirga imtechensis AK7]|uniref:Uncharacterized protein n=1 Tax=Fulvivirga imtechensis AK7 TaxID=1237149 RepID=L8JUY1_9BACT|nr:hypothetical protein C900_02033 [Fulvivirga imtechensis AK7]